MKKSKLLIPALLSIAALACDDGDSPKMQDAGSDARRDTAAQADTSLPDVPADVPQTSDTAVKLDAGVNPDTGVTTDGGGPDATPILPVLANPDFSEDPVTTWVASYMVAEVATLSSFRGEAAYVHIVAPRMIWEAQIAQNFLGTFGGTYTLSFKVRATDGTEVDGGAPADAGADAGSTDAGSTDAGITKKVQVYIQEDEPEGDYTTYGTTECVVGTTPQVCQTTGTVTEDVRVKFGIQGGDTLGDYIVDDAVLTRN